MPTIPSVASLTPESLKAAAKEKIQTALSSAGLSIDLREGSYTDALISECAYIVYRSIQYSRSLMDAAVPGPDGGPYLDAFAKTFGLTRTAGAKATVQITFSGTDGTAIPAGTWVVTTSNLRYATASPITITSGTAQVLATAEFIGAAYNVAPGSITRLQSSLPGVTAVNNAQASGGIDPESDLSFYTRIHDHLSKPRTSGNVNDFEAWARECSGVGYVKVLRIWNGPGTVKVVLAGEDKLPVSESVRSAVAENIESKRLIGPNVTVVSAAAVTVNVVAKCLVDSGSSADTIKGTFTKTMENLLQEMPFGSGEPIRYNRVMALLLSEPGVTDVVSLTLNGAKDNVRITAEQVPKLGTVTVTAG